MDAELAYRFYNLLFPAELELPGQTLVSWRPIRAKGFYFCTGAAVFTENYVGVTHQNGYIMQKRHTTPAQIVEDMVMEIWHKDSGREIIGGFAWGGIEKEVLNFMDALGTNDVPILGQYMNYEQKDCKDVIAVPRVTQVLMHSMKRGYLSVGQEH